MISPAVLAVAIFVIVYALIASERLHKAKAALAGAALMLLLGLIDQRAALHGDPSRHVEGIDWNTILLLIGMMIIVNITRRTGLFEWLAIKCGKWGQGYPIRIMVLISIVTALISACLDNVTTVLVVAPVMMLICQALELDPVPFLITVIISSNIGGTATLIGHPPNIMIGSAAQLDFMDFLSVDGPLALIVLVAMLITTGLLLTRRVKVTDKQRAEIMAFEETKAITDRPLLHKCLFVIVLTLIGFVLQGYLKLEPATIALGGAALLLLLHREGPEEIFREVEWPTIFFFIGLFVMVGALVSSGVVTAMARWMVAVTGGSTPAMAFTLLGMSAIICGLIDNIAYTAMTIPMIVSIATGLNPQAGSAMQALHAPNVMPLWWALSMGAGLGANFTLVAAATNIVVAGFAERSGHPISFVRYLKYGIPLTLQSIVIAGIYLWLRFLR